MENIGIQNQIKGKAIELKVATYLMENGFEVSMPISAYCRYDIIAEYKGKFHRIQCKSSTKSRNGNGIEFSCRSTSINTHRIKNVKYNKNEIDYFATIDDSTGKIYIIPVEMCNSSKKLSYQKTINGNATLAENFAADKIIDKIKKNKEIKCEYINNHMKAVAMYDKRGKLLKNFSSLNEAAKYISGYTELKKLKSVHNNIKKSVGRIKSAYGYKWEIIDAIS